VQPARSRATIMRRIRGLDVSAEAMLRSQEEICSGEEDITAAEEEEDITAAEEEEEEERAGTCKMWTLSDSTSWAGASTVNLLIVPK
jgi:hypothetical protein